MDKRYIYVVLTRANTAISRVIQFVKNDEYTHAAISLDMELNSMYSFSRKHAYNPFIGIFKREDLNKGLFRIRKNIPSVIMEIEVTKEQYEKAKLLLEHFISNSNQYKYNYKGLLYIFLNISMCNDNRFLCSEFVYHILKESQIVDLNIPRNLVRPQNLLNIKSRLVFKGNIKEFRPIDRFETDLIHTPSVSLAR